MDKIFAIDFGTAYCRAAVAENGRPEMVKDAEGQTAMPSAGTKTQQETDGSGLPAFPAASLLLQMKWRTQQYTGEKLREAVIAVPAGSGIAERRALGQAAQIAGIELKGMIGEPSAAALYWWSTHKRDQKILVYCQGAGFTDVSLFDISGRKMTVLASESGRIGGNDMDECIVRYMISEFQKENGVDLSGDPAAVGRLWKAAAGARTELSSPMKRTSEIYLPFITTTDSGMLHFEMHLQREKVEELTRDLMGRSAALVSNVLKEAGIPAPDLTAVIMAGGCTHMPMVSSMLTQAAGREPEKDADLDQGIVLGTACCAASLSSDIYMSDFPEPEFLRYSEGSDEDPDELEQPEKRSAFNGTLTEQEITELTAKAAAMEESNRELKDVFQQGGLRSAERKNNSPSGSSGPSGNIGNSGPGRNGNTVNGAGTSSGAGSRNTLNTKERGGLDENTVCTLVRQFLPVADNLERALKAAEGRADDPLAAGIQKTYRQLCDILKSMGVEPIEAVGHKFDPMFHCAVQHVDDAGVGDGIVVAEFQKGYTCHGAVIRFSMVVVAN